MAKLVEIIGVTHNPFLPRRLAAPQSQPVDDQIRAGFEQMRTKLADSRPDLVISIGSDHLNQWFMDNMPAFLIGKAPRAKGPFPHETQQFGVPPYETAIDTGAARGIIEGGFEHGVDFAFSDELLVDHSITVPLTYIRPEADLPIVPLFTNVMAPPLPPARRFFDVGCALRRIIGDLPSSRRVAVVCSGHLSVEIGGPRMDELWSKVLDPEFDAGMVELIGRGDVDGLLREANEDRMMRAGNFTSGFLNFLLLVGLANGRAASQADCVLAEAGSAPFLSWDLHKDLSA